MAEFLRYNEFIVDLRNSAFCVLKGLDSDDGTRAERKSSSFGGCRSFMCRRQSAGKQPAGYCCCCACTGSWYQCGTDSVKVYVSGAVAKPGLYEIPAGSRATAAIAAAGGMTLEANPDKVNLAKLLKDGMQVNVPRLSARQLREQTAPVNAGAAAEAAGANTLVSVKTAAESGRGTAKAGGKVHLNTATAAELTALPGVGDITAQRILEYRAAHGFASIEDVMKVKGIGKAKFSKMQPYLEL